MSSKAYHSVDSNVSGLCRFEILCTEWSSLDKVTARKRSPASGDRQIYEQRMERTGINLVETVFLPPQASGCLTRAYDNLKAVLRLRLSAASAHPHDEL